MAENLPYSPENRHESDVESHSEKHEAAKHTNENVSSGQREEQLEHIRGAIEHEAKAKDEVAKFDTKSEKPKETHTPPPANRDLKKSALRKELSHIRREMKPADRIGSKVIHNPIVRNVSEVSAKTISRPSGLLVGGLMAFIGSGLYYYLAKHIGFKYNYLVFIILFAGGFVVGLILELVVYTLNSKKTAK